MKRREVTLTSCDFCGGPCTWTIKAGEVWFYCDRQCDGFMNLELFEESWVPSRMRGDDTDDDYQYHGPPVPGGPPSE